MAAWDLKLVGAGSETLVHSASLWVLGFLQDKQKGLPFLGLGRNYMAEDLWRAISGKGYVAVSFMVGRRLSAVLKKSKA